MDKFAIARALAEISSYLELSDSNRFKAQAFDRASRAVSAIDQDVEELVKTGRIYDISGIGKGTGAIIEELVRTGRTKYLEELRAQYPPGIFEMMRVPGLGLKKIGVVYSELGISSLDELEAAARDGSLNAIKGFGQKTAQKILDGIAFARKNTSRFLLPIGIEVGELLREQLATIEEVDDAEVAGSVRRRLEIIRNVNLVIATRDADAVLKRLRTMVDAFEAIDDTTFKGVARNEIDLLFHLTPPNDFGHALLKATGSEEFVAAFETKIGKRIKARTEHELFEKAGIPFVEPERREDAAELARKKRVKLVHFSDLRGTFHVHTTWSDGRHTVLEMLTAAKERGFEYVGISDHSKAAYYAGGLTEQQLTQQQAEIAAREKEVTPMRVFRGTEADILPDGSIDYGAKTLDLFDFVVASIHSQFKMEKEQMTERILRALDDPHVTFLGHLTGRKLLGREGYTFDFDRVFDRAAERGVMIEINGNPNRLELDWRYIRRALDRGVVLSIHPDAHSINEYNALISGTWVARKGGLSAKEIFNTRPVDEVAEWFEKRKGMSS
ncbi:MAG TPA: helix-hairpin-helix domain-containing protein [Thermoanaerobaculia bacterium]|nr:helix-hairpin-helix domain-containing protein [Thermoanaerobaculia bacterium]